MSKYLARTLTSTVRVCGNSETSAKLLENAGCFSVISRRLLIPSSRGRDSTTSARHLQTSSSVAFHVSRRGFHSARKSGSGLCPSACSNSLSSVLTVNGLSSGDVNGRHLPSRCELHTKPAFTPRVYTSLQQLDQHAPELEPMPPRRQVFMVTPRHFDVTYVINPHMQAHVGKVDQARCFDQWSHAKEAITALGIRVREIEGRPGLPDMVYSANLGLSYPGKSGVEMYMSNMAVNERKGEVPFYAEACEKAGFQVQYLPEHLDFEGQGDALWHGTKRLIWAGYGFRSDLEVYDILSAEWQVPIVALRLHDPYFYHIDTCLAVLSNDAALFYPGAFKPEGVEMIRRFFPRLVEATEEDARARLACNCFCPDGENVVLNAGSRETNRRLREAGFNPVEVDVSEFLKGGGSVCCMKMFTW